MLEPVLRLGVVRVVRERLLVPEARTEEVVLALKYVPDKKRGVVALGLQLEDNLKVLLRRVVIVCYPVGERSVEIGIGILAVDLERLVVFRYGFLELAGLEERVALLPVLLCQLVDLWRWRDGRLGVGS